jgi:alkanesulfonate monooxygenase SsuD/methylene tetrahydromethanopterin reductase-like flavin-dependent oxidoreductase (luciferase family)
MKIGLCFPYTQEDIDRKRMLEWFRRVDEGPFSTLSCGERMVGPSVDMMATLAAAAAVTNRVHIAPTLYVLPMHPAIKVAKHAATLDLIADGRTTIVVGTGGRPQDYRCMEKPREGRYSRMDAQVAEIRRIWAGELPFEGAEPIGPKPVQKGGPKILAGSMGPKSIARASKWADGVYSWSGNGVAAEMKQQYQWVSESWEKAGRTTAPKRVGGFWYSLAPNADERLKAYVYKYIKVMGDAPAKALSRMVDRSTPDAVRASLEAYAELGYEECWLNTATSEIAEIDELIKVMQKLGWA